MLALFGPKPAFSATRTRLLHLSRGAVLALAAAIGLLVAGPGFRGSLAALAAVILVGSGWTLSERFWAEAHAIPFLPHEEWLARWKALPLPWPYSLADGALLGLVVVPIVSGRPEWREPAADWVAVALCALLIVVLARRRRPAAADRNGPR